MTSPDPRRRLHPFGSLSIDEFLSGYWQQRPLLVRQALPGFHSPLSADLLAGLACEDDVESRLVLERHGTHPWELRHGPFSERDLAGLPASHWSLLIQEANKHLAPVHDFMAGFRFIPDWRVDDVMISLAPEHGSVGPHVDQYDVFLVQAQGRRRWSIGAPIEPPADCLGDTELSILRHFEPTESWVVEPGDLLYLPPGVPHHGVALELCQTWSVGFRAPSASDLAAYLGEHLADTAERYVDGALTDCREHPGRIGPDSLAQVRALLDRHLTAEHIAPWFGRLATENRAGLLPEPPDPEYTSASLGTALQRHAHCRRSRYSRFAYHASGHAPAWLFVDGHAVRVPVELAVLLCDPDRIDCAGLAAALASDTTGELLVDLFNTGSLGFGEEP